MRYIGYLVVLAVFVAAIICWVAFYSLCHAIAQLVA